MIYLLSVISSLHLSFIKNKKQIGWSLLLIAYLAFLMGAVTPGHSFDTYAYQLIYSWTPAHTGLNQVTCICHIFSLS